MAKREYGSGGVTWVTTTKVRLSTRVTGERRTRVVKVAHKEHGGRGQAAEALASFEDELTAVADAPPALSGETIRSVIAYYIDHVTNRGKTTGTIDTYEVVARRLPDALATKPIEEVTTDDLDRFYNSLKERNLADRTVRTTHAVLRAALKQAAKAGRIPSDPSENATPPDQPRGSKAKVSATEVYAMVTAALEDKDPVLAMAMVLASTCGLRRGELCGLQWGDFNSNARTLRIERQWVPGKGGQYLALLKSDTGMIDDARTVTLGPGLIGDLLRYKAWLGHQLEVEPDGWLLSHDAGATPLRAKSLGEAITALGRRLGIKVTTHSFRRTSSTELVASGVDVDTAARRQGHTKEVMLRDYVLGSDDKAVAAASTLEARLIDQGLPIGELFGA